MPTDIQIAQAATPRRIDEIAAAANIPEEALFPYGRYVAKVDPLKIKGEQKAKLILVTAINPTPAGEGKTTVSVGLADGMTKIGKKAMLALREPSLGPVFGVKGGATGGGYAQVLPMESINLHFTGDLHAITAANNLLAAMVDNHIQQGNKLGIDPRQVSWRRCLDVNDRQLRSITSGLGGKMNGMPREDGFDITAASEVMAVFCLSKDLTDLKARLARLQVARTFAWLRCWLASCRFMCSPFTTMPVMTTSASPSSPVTRGRLKAIWRQRWRRPSATQPGSATPGKAPMPLRSSARCSRRCSASSSTG